MSKKIANQFNPNYAIPPGEILEEELESRGMPQAELAQRMGLARKTINEIVKGKAPITHDSALKLERIFRQPAEYWLNLENLFQQAQLRQQEHKKLEADSQWLERLPLNQMIKFGWIEKSDNKVKQLEEVLSFFGIASVGQWDVVWGRLRVAYRKSKAFDVSAEAISVWLRQGEIEAQSINCSPYDAQKFRNGLNDVRALTRQKDPKVFVPRLQELCATCGVAVVFVPELEGTRVSGATRWLTKDKAIIQLSLRYKSDDHLWFTFFHEAGHIIKHGKKELFLEGGEIKDAHEDEANEFASSLLVPPKMLSDFIQQGNLSAASVTAFADLVGISPGIVVGQLQHRGVLPYTHLNWLKQRFKWVHELDK